MRFYANVLTVTAAFGVLGLGSAEAQTALRIDTWLSPVHQQNAVVMSHWAKAVEEATQGRVKITLSYPPNVNPATFFDRLTDGISDVAWGFHGYNPGRFVLTQIVELPGLDANCIEASVAYQRIHDKYLAPADEHRGMKLLAVFSHGAGVLHTRQPVTTIEQFKGLKIRTGGGVSGDVSNALGVVQVPAPANKVYEIISQGVADGSYMPMESKAGFKLKEVAPYSLILPGGYYYGSFWIGMNEAKFNKLSKAEQEGINKVSGEAQAWVAGRAWEAADQNGINEAKAAGNTLTTAAGDFAKQLTERLKRIETDWIEKASKKGINARAALDELRAEVQKLKGKS